MCSVPRGSYYVARYDNKTNNIELSEFDLQEDRIKKLIQKNKRRIKQLNKIRSQLSLRSNLNRKQLFSFKKIYKSIKKGRFRKDASRIRAQAKKLIRVLKRNNKALFEAIEILESCKNREPLPPSGATLGVEEFSFTHPDFGVTYYMRGITIRTTLRKKQREAAACVSLTNPLGSVAGRFPSEEALRFTSNPCEYFNLRLTRNPIYCNGALGKRVGAVWLEWGVSSSSIYSGSSLSNLALRQLESAVEQMGTATLRPYRKKRGCRP